MLFVDSYGEIAGGFPKVRKKKPVIEEGKTETGAPIFYVTVTEDEKLPNIIEICAISFRPGSRFELSFATKDRQFLPDEEVIESFKGKGVGINVDYEDQTYFLSVNDFLDADCRKHISDLIQQLGYGRYLIHETLSLGAKRTKGKID